MRNKPELSYARIVDTDETISSDIIKTLSPKAIEALGIMGNKELGTENLGVGEWFILNEYVFDEYHKFMTKGSRSELSLYRLVGGCNHLSSFDNPGAEKCEDYDSLSASQILDLPLEYKDALSIIESRFLGKKLRVVARSAENSDSYGKRYYLFAVEEC